MPTVGRLDELFHTLSFSGIVDISRYPEFRESFTQTPHAVPVLVDLTEATAVDSTFLSEMLLFRHRRTGRVAILIPRAGDLPHLFAMVKMHSKIGVFTDRASAIQELLR